jgi:alpha-L-fucosidase
MVLTTKHHEGFALFDAPNSEYCSGALLGRDIVKEFADSARAAGMRVGFYHSVIDWHQKDYDNTICRDLCYPVNQEKMLQEKQIPRNHEAYQEYLHTQVRHLVRNYGPLDIMWWDYSQGDLSGEAWKAQELMQTCRDANPGVIFNNRLYSFSGFDPSEDSKKLDYSKGDFSTPEKRIPRAGYPGRDWETCMTVGNRWGYHRDNHLHYKSPSTIISQLQECAAKGGNLLLNIGPKADGSIPEGVVDVFKRVGAWMKVNGESIYKSRPLGDAVELPEEILGSVVWDDIYLFLPARRAGEEEMDYVFAIPANQVDAVYPTILGQDDCEVTMERVTEEVEGQDEPDVYLEITVPAEAWTNAVEGMPVLKLGYDG